MHGNITTNYLQRPDVWGAMMIPWLARDTPFPPVESALVSPNGLLAAGGELNAHRVLEAYCQGIFPWFNPGEPVLWWSPDPRMVLIPSEFRISRSLSRTLRNGAIEVRCDTSFEQVMRCCAAQPFFLPLRVALPSFPTPRLRN